MTMKIMTKLMVALALIVLVAACKNRDAEKKIAELESRLAQMEAKNQAPATPAQTPQPTPQPETKPEGPLPVLSFETTAHDFGTINEGQKVVHTTNSKIRARHRSSFKVHSLRAVARYPIGRKNQSPLGAPALSKLNLTATANQA